MDTEGTSCTQQNSVLQDFLWVEFRKVVFSMDELGKDLEPCDAESGRVQVAARISYDDMTFRKKQRTPTLNLMLTTLVYW